MIRSRRSQYVAPERVQNVEKNGTGVDLEALPSIQPKAATQKEDFLRRFPGMKESLCPFLLLPLWMLSLPPGHSGSFPENVLILT